MFCDGAMVYICFFFNDTATTEIYTYLHTLSLHDALPILSLTLEQRPEYSYEGPEIIYTFWAKHGPCQVTGCGHRTPIMTKSLMAVKSDRKSTRLNSSH